MKNVLKRFVNFTQARSAKVPLVIIALVAVIGFSFAACGGGNGGGGGGNGGGDDDPDPFLGEKIEISGEQVYTYDGEDYKFIKFDDSLTIKDTGGGKGAIANGKLTFTIGTPTDLEDISESFSENQDWDNIEYEPSDAKCFDLNLQITGHSEYNVVIKENESGTDNNGWAEDVYYMYVDRDVTITGKGKTLPHHDDDDYETYKTEDFKLSLKKGWNAVCWKDSWKGDTETRSLSLRNPKNAKWVVSDRGWSDD